MIPGRPYGRRNETRLIIRRVMGRDIAAELEMAIGGGSKAGSIIDRLTGAVDRAMAKAEDEIGRATDVLVDEIVQGTKSVKMAILKEATTVRAKFGKVVDNAAGMAEDAVEEAEKALGATKEPDEKTPAVAAPTAGAGASAGETPRPNGSGGGA